MLQPGGLVRGVAHAVDVRTCRELALVHVDPAGGLDLEESTVTTLDEAVRAARMKGIVVVLQKHPYLARCPVVKQPAWDAGPHCLLDNIAYHDWKAYTL